MYPPFPKACATLSLSKMALPETPHRLIPPCIHCRRPDGPRTIEHVLQHALGAVATLPREVCDECNNAFSPIDKQFIDAVDFYHLGRNMRRHLSKGRVTDEDGRLLAVNLGDGEATFPAQLHEDANSAWTLIATSEEEKERFLREISTPGSAKVKARVDPQLPRIVIVRSAPNVFLVEGPDPVRVDRICSEVKTTGLQRAWEKPSEPGSDLAGASIQYRTSLKLEPFSRAMAKIALNFVCYRLGAETALRSEFDGLRSFARNGTGMWSDYVVPALLSGGDDDAAARWVNGFQHVLILTRTLPAQGDRYVLMIVLGGRYIGRVYMTAPGRSGLPQGTWRLSRFDPAERTVANFVLPADILQAVANPAAIGVARAFEHLQQESASGAGHPKDDHPSVDQSGRNVIDEPEA